MRISPPCRESLEGEAGRLLFATNAGMFDPALKPVGLYVEQGRELVHANTKSGYGNFHMKPNGVFYISADRAAVAETQAFLKQRPQARPGDAIRADAGDRRALASSFRPAQHVAQSAQWCGRTRGWQSHIRHLSGRVSFDAFARLFRDGLNCPNALFLDGGSASSLYAPSLNRHGNIVPLGPMLAVFERNRGASRQ